MYEAPLMGQTGIEGKFLIVAHNTSFNYWIVTLMEDTIKGQSEKVHFTVLGKYSISTNGNSVIISKELIGSKVDCGDNSLGSFFDPWNGRRKAYGTNRSEIIAKNNKIKNNLNNVKDTKKVKIYKKRKSN